MENFSFQEFIESKPESERPLVLERIKKSMYQAISDPMFFKFQAGQATKEDWLTARQLILDLDQRLVDEHGVEQTILDYFRANP